MFPIRTNTLASVFFVKAAQYGTAFTIDVEGTEYLVTARHLFDLQTATHQVALYRNNAWSTFTPTAIVFSRSEADIAVLRLHERLTPGHLQISASIAHFALGQDVFSGQSGWKYVVTEARRVPVLEVVPGARGRCHLDWSKRTASIQGVQHSRAADRNEESISHRPTRCSAQALTRGYRSD